MSATYRSKLVWTGAKRGATVDARTFSRDLAIAFDGQQIDASAAPEFRGDPERVNPEEMLVGAVSACHALTYLFLAARKGLHVVSYHDDAEGRLAQIDGRTQMAGIVLRPHIALEPGGDLGLAESLVEQAHAQCFVANSLNTPVAIEPHFGVAACAA